MPSYRVIVCLAGRSVEIMAPEFNMAKEAFPVPSRSTAGAISHREAASTLALRAIERCPPSQPDRLYCIAADAAGEPLAPVDKIVELKIAGRAVAIDVIAQSGPTLGDRLGQCRPYLVDETLESTLRDAARGNRRPDPGAEQCFVRIDVAD